MSNDGQDTTPPIPSSSEVSLGVRIDRICGEFEELLKGGQDPKIETYLKELPEDERGTLLEELLGLELDYRAKAGDSFTSEEYTLRFPEHASSVAELVVNVRQRKPGETSSNPKKPEDPPATKQAGSSASTQRSHSPDGPVRIGPYEIIQPCGRGGMGVVYKAWHEFFKQYRAIKVLPSNFDDDDISRFSMEIELAGRLNHPNIVRAHEANREHGVLYLVMEYVDGINLDHLVKHHKRLPLGLACEMIRQAADGLQHAHEHFLVHRDIKPSNLMINQEGRVKILDFGLARLHAEHNASRLTKHGSVMGTLDFMAPEQWEDPMGATIQADIYSLGCTLYYLVTGTPPYGGEDYSHWLKKQEAHRRHPVPRLEHEQGELLQPIIDRMMAKSTSDRFTSPAEIVEALESLSDASELIFYAETPVPKVSTKGLSRTPIPTVNVPPDEIESDWQRQSGERFSEDSEVNSGEKTMRPNQSRTDVDSEQRRSTGSRPKKPAWHKSVRNRVMLGVLAVVLLAGAWVYFRPPQNTGLAEQMGALPGLNGGLNGDWWFAEMPWYGPGIRKAFMEALRNGEDEIAGVSLDDLKTRLTSARTQDLQSDLRAIAEKLKTRLPEPEQTWTGQILVAAEHAKQETNEDTYEKELLKILPKSLRSDGDLDESFIKNRSATELHFLANILHHASTNNSLYAAKAEQAYGAAIDAYDADEPLDVVLQALARSDWSRFLADRREYSASIDQAKRAAGAVPEGDLFQISLHCELADQYRKFGSDSAASMAHIEKAKMRANRMQLDPFHPLRAEILERSAWVNVDHWQMEEARQNFHDATQIREANQEQGNEFAWRSILLNGQGQAMALHFLGRDETYVVGIGKQQNGAIRLYEDLQTLISSPPSDRPWGTYAERATRLPNIYERWGDVYLFDHADQNQYKDAVDKYQKAVEEAGFQEFESSATLWFHLIRLYYKQALAMTLHGDGEAAGTLIENEAVPLEDQFRTQLTLETFKNQRAAYALEQEVARAIKNLLEAGLEETKIKAELASLQKLIDDVDKSKVDRGNIEVLILVFSELFERHDKLTADQIKQLGHQLWIFTADMREGDKAIRTDYLKPVFRSAIDAIESLPVSDQNEKVLRQLKAAMPSED